MTKVLLVVKGKTKVLFSSFFTKPFKQHNIKFLNVWKVMFTFWANMQKSAKNEITSHDFLKKK